MFKGIIKILGGYVIAATIIATPIISHILHDEVHVSSIEPTPIPIVEEVTSVPMRTFSSNAANRMIRVMENEIEVVIEDEEVTEDIEESVIEEVVEEELPLTQEEIELIALLTMAEAEGESEEGKRLVIDTVLNRVDSELSYFPDTVKDVIYQKEQFTSMWNGRVDKCYVSEDICQLVIEELKSRTNYDVLWFRASYYGAYGTPLLAEGNHYFSSI